MVYQDKVTLKKVGWSIFVVVVSLILQHIPVWGVQSDILKRMFMQTTPLSFTDTLSGGALSQLGIGGFGVTSIIMAGIILQLAGIAIPKLEKIHSDGEHGRLVYERVNFILAMLMTLVIGVVIATTMKSSTLYYAKGVMAVIPVIEWLIGTAIIVKLAQSVHLKGIGNGPTLLLAANIASRVPSDLVARLNVRQSAQVWAIALSVLFVVVVLAVYLQAGSIKVRIQQTRKAVSIMNAEGEVPVPLAAASVLPVVYAQAIIAVPSMISMLTGKSDGFIGELLKFTSQNNWYNPTSWQHVAGLIIYILLVVFGSTYASKLAFSSPDVANRMRERGDVLPDVTPGKETEKYLERRRKKLARIAAFMLLLIAVVPDFMLVRLGIRGFSFMGTSLIIMMAAFWDLRLRLTGRLKHHNKKYVLFGKEV